MIIGAATMVTGSHSIYYTRTIGIGSAGIASNGAVVVRGYMDYEAWSSGAEAGGGGLDMATMPMLMEIELLHEHNEVPACKVVVKYIAEADGTLVCSLQKDETLFLPESTYRLIRAWADPMPEPESQGWADRTERHADCG
jgi:hypothetical protein